VEAVEPAADTPADIPPEAAVESAADIPADTRNREERKGDKPDIVDS